MAKMRSQGVKELRVRPEKNSTCPEGFDVGSWKEEGSTYIIPRYVQFRMRAAESAVSVYILGNTYYMHMLS